MIHEIIPAVLGENFTQVKRKIELVEGLTDWVQIDICDGAFVDSVTWNNPGDALEIQGKIKIEAHLMIEHPEAVLAHWVAAVDRTLIHYESTDHLEEMMKIMDERMLKIGIALNLETPLNVLEPFMDRLKLVQLMSIAEIGHHGEPFARPTLAKIKDLRGKYPNVIINIDGGIDLETGKACLIAGANNLVVGSALWESGDLPGTIKKFQQLTA